MTNKEFSALIEQYNKVDTEQKKLASEAKALSEQIKEEFKRRNVIAFVTENNIEGKIVNQTTMSFDNDKLVAWLKANGKNYLVKETAILDAVKSELKNNIITESAMQGIKTETTVRKLYVAQCKD